MDSESVLKIFREITKIPRESGHEEKMTAFLIDFAKSHNLAWKRDKTGNVLITKEASPDKKNVPTLVLQAHQDMVCEKVAGSSHDFDKDPIQYVIKDGWMVAEETTLGADDGIGIASCLALLESNLDMGKIECLFTISEETGMDGAMALEPGFFTGKTLINLDSEDEGQMFVGCAGGVNTMAWFKYKEEERRNGYAALSLRLYNTIGGHSGDDIDKGRINTVQQLARFLFDLSKYVDYQLISFNGGGKHNAIAREAEAIIYVPSDKESLVKEKFKVFHSTLKAEYSGTDPDVKYDASDVEAGGNAIESKVALNLVSSLVAVHHGVLSMSSEIPGLVQTSSNLASVKMKGMPGQAGNDEEGKIIEICTSQRSSVDSEKDFIADKIEACFHLAGAQTRRSDPYPGWKPDMNSHILKVAVSSYRKLFGKDPEVKAIHAGLECGLFLEKFPDLDMISFGPTLRGVHAPGEKLDLESNEKFVRHLVDVVTSFK